jgi:primosomal protein N' (replication factor Y) (superfamily II helicase)
MTLTERLVRVAVPVPLAEGFDYTWAGPSPAPAPGCRVRVPFGRSERIGVVLEHPTASELPAAKLKPVIEAIDSAPLIDRELLATIVWAAGYYHHPIGAVVKHALPGLLRKGRPLERPGRRAWRLVATDPTGSLEALRRRAPRQAAAVEALADVAGLEESALRQLGATPEVLRRLEAKGVIERYESDPAQPHSGRDPAGTPSGPDSAIATLPVLTPEQREAVAAVMDQEPGFAAFLLHGVTGSGKTEVFLRLIRAELDAGRQTLLLVPEIGLTPQLVARLRERFGDELAVIHSALTESERAAAWRNAYDRSANLIVGTRSAVFAPLPAAGLIIVDEEHDTSYKQQQGFRYSARDLAVVRARGLGVPVVLASATPSLESLRNALEGRYRLLSMPTRVGAAGAPTYRVIDLNKHATREGLSTPLLAAMDAHLDRGNQVLLFLNRRGFAPALFCSECQKVEECERCDARLTVHARSGVLRCHHCGHERALHWACPSCGRERIAVGAGTQRVTDTLEALYPDRRIARLDRDVTGRIGALDAILEHVASGATEIIVGTQMLTKGHDFPKVTLVGVLNADQGLFGTDFRSDERLAQTIVQVAGRAGRRDRPGEVIVQTHFPDHPLLRALLTRDYLDFAKLALEERRLAGWPPYSYLAVVRGEAARRERVFEFLEKVRRHALAQQLGVEVLGPAPDVMERKSGRYRAQLLLQSTARQRLHALVASSLAAIGSWRETRRLRWSIDVDPVEL